MQHWGLAPLPVNIFLPEEDFIFFKWIQETQWNEKENPVHRIVERGIEQAEKKERCQVYREKFSQLGVGWIASSGLYEHRGDKGQKQCKSKYSFMNYPFEEHVVSASSEFVELNQVGIARFVDMDTVNREPSQTDDRMFLQYVYPVSPRVQSSLCRAVPYIENILEPQVHISNDAFTGFESLLRDGGDDQYK